MTPPRDETPEIEPAEPDRNARLIPFPGNAPAETNAQTPATPEPPSPSPSVRDEVVEGEIVPEEEPRLLTALRRVITVPSTRADRPSGDARIPAPIRLTIRTVWVIGHGHTSWISRVYDAWSHGAIREQIRLARLTGNATAVAEWTDRLVKHKLDRHKRLQNLPTNILSVLQAVIIGVAVIIGLLIIGGAWVSLTPDGMDWNDWWAAVKSWVDLGIGILDIALHVVLWGVVPVWLILAWREGRRAGMAPRWMVSADERAELDSTITADALTLAMRHMKIPTLAKYLDNGGMLEFIVPPREQGGGTYTQIHLPHGVIAAEFLPGQKVELLAGNLNRHMHETWPQRQPKADARVLDLWIADKGTMDKPAPPWPLLKDGEFDVFRDRLPFGVTMRSDQIAIGMLQKHWLIGATSNQGKSTVIRLTALGLALDVTVELHIADLKGDGDWRMFKPRATTLVEGGTPQHAAAACEMLEWGVTEVARRLDRKQKMGIVGPITRELSRQKGSGFHPVWLIVDECQIMYGAPHPVGGVKDDSRAVKAAKQLHDQARAMNVHLMQATHAQMTAHYRRESAKGHTYEAR